MSSRLAPLYFAFLFLLVTGNLDAQSYAQYGSGSTSLRSTFDPLAPSTPPRIPATGSNGFTSVPRLPVIPPGQYQSLKSVPPRVPIGPPTTTWFSPSGDPVNVPSRLPISLGPTLSFQGIQQTIYHPPSSNIAVGPQDVIQIVNSTVARYDRNGNLTNQTDLTQWFPGLYPFIICNSLTNCILGDVNINYDQMHGRFVMVLQALDSTAQTSYLLVSVSSGATYASGWTNWAISLRDDGQTMTTNWGDFPQVGLDNVALYVTTNQFSFSARTFQYAKLRIIKKSDLYTTTPTVTLPYQDVFNLKNADNTVASTLQVPHLRGPAQIATTNGFFMINASDTPNATYLTLWQINNPASNPTVTRVTLNNVWPYSYPASAPQAGSAIPLDTGPSSFNKVILRDGLMYASQSTGYADEPDTVTYDLIDVVKNKVTLQQRWVNGNFFYPAFDVPASIGAGNTLPNNLIVGTTTSPAGALTFAGITNVKAGEDFYDLTDNGTTARWGDYFGGAIDPVQGGLWVSGEYAKPHVSNVATWGTWNAFFPWATSQEFNDVDLASPYFNYINVMKLWGVTNGCSVNPNLYCPTTQVTREILSVFLIRSIFGDTFSYPTTPYFADVPVSDPFFPYVQKMKEQGITNGCAAPNFCPNDIATRETAAVFIVRGKLKGLFGDTFTYPTTQIFADVPPSDPNFSFVQKFSELGLTTGCSAAPVLFCPGTPLTRDMTAVFLVRAFFN